MHELIKLIAEIEHRKKLDSDVVYFMRCKLLKSLQDMEYHYKGLKKSIESVDKAVTDYNNAIKLTNTVPQ